MWTATQLSPITCVECGAQLYTKISILGAVLTALLVEFLSLIAVILFFSVDFVLVSLGLGVLLVLLILFASLFSRLAVLQIDSTPHDA